MYLMRIRGRHLLLCAAVLLTGCHNTDISEDPTPVDLVVESQADSILQAMSECLAGAEQFSFRAEVSYDTLDGLGQKIEYGGVSEVQVRRPDGLRAHFVGDERQTQAVYNGETITIYN